MAEAYPVAGLYAGRPVGVVRLVCGGMARDEAVRLTGVASKYRSPSQLMARSRAALWSMTHVAAFCCQVGSVPVIRFIGSVSQDAPICQEWGVIAEIQIIRKLPEEHFGETPCSLADGQCRCGGPSAT